MCLYLQHTINKLGQHQASLKHQSIGSEQARRCDLELSRNLHWAQI